MNEKYEVWVRFYCGSTRMVLSTTDKAAAEKELRMYKGGDNRGAELRTIPADPLVQK